MSFSLKPKNTGGGSKVDWDAINEKVEEGTQIGIISLIVDLGIQKGTEGVFTKKQDGSAAETVYASQSEAEAAIAHALTLDDRLTDLKVTKTAEGYSIPVSFSKPKDSQEVAIFVDLPDTLVEYEAGNPKPYRIMLNSSFKGVIKGFALKAAPPKTKGGVWTFAPNSPLYRLANATRTPEIVQEGEDNMNIGLLLGKPLLINIEKKDGYVKVKGTTPLMKGQTAPELPVPVVGISFDNASVELLEAAGIRKGIIDKIKESLNYHKAEGKKMKAAIEAYEAKFAQGASANAGAATQTAKTSVVEEVESNIDDDLDPFGDAEF